MTDKDMRADRVARVKGAFRALSEGLPHDIDGEARLMASLDSLTAGIILAVTNGDTARAVKFFEDAFVPSVRDSIANFTVEKGTHNEQDE